MHAINSYKVSLHPPINGCGVYATRDINGLKSRQNYKTRVHSSSTYHPGNIRPREQSWSGQPVIVIVKFTPPPPPATSTYCNAVIKQDLMEITTLDKILCFFNYLIIHLPTPL